MDIRPGDILTMKKPHPCGSRTWRVLRVGADFRLKCEGCGHEVMLPRAKAERNVRAKKPFDGALDDPAKKTGGK